MANVLSGTRGVLIVFFSVGMVVYAISGGPNSGSIPAASRASSAFQQSAPVSTKPASVVSENSIDSDSAPAASADTSDTGPTSRWTYDSSKDELRNITTRFASLASENKLQFGFPYGEATGKIVLRQKGKALDVMLTLDRGQFICNSFRGDTVSVKFDDGAIQRFECAESADGSTNVIFLRNAARFAKELKKSSHVQIEAEFFQAGLQQFTFNSAGLRW